jgi:hypothetical protein
VRLEIEEWNISDEPSERLRLVAPGGTGVDAPDENKGIDALDAMGEPVIMVLKFEWPCKREQ